MCHAIRHGSSQDSIHPHRWRIFIEFHWNCFFAQARRVSPSAVGTKRKGKGRILFGNMMRMRLMSKTVSQRLVVLSVRGMAGRMGGYAPLPGKASSSDSWMRLLVGNAANLRKRCLSNPFGYGSIPIDTFLVGWTSIYQLFWGSLGTRVLTHPHLPVKTSIHNPYQHRTIPLHSSGWSLRMLQSVRNPVSSVEWHALWVNSRKIYDIIYIYIYIYILLIINQ